MIRPRPILLAAAHTVISAVAWWLYMGLFLVAAPLSLALITVIIGIPTTIGLLAVMRGAAELERFLSNRLLGTRIQPPVPISELGSGRWGQLVVLMTSPSTWRAIVFLIIRMAFGFAAFIGLLVGGGLTAGLAVVPFVDGALDIGSWESSSGWGSVWVLPVAVAAGVATVVGAAAQGWVSARIGEALLGPSERERVRLLEKATADLNARQLLARELHDSVGHTMSTVVVQAAAARRVADSDPEFVGTALVEIEGVARRSLEELDAVLSVLRDGDRADLAAIGSAGPTLADLDQLLAAVRALGVPITTTVAIDPKSVPVEVSSEAYRIVQEGLTNVVRHAGASPTTLALDEVDGELVIRVRDAGPVPGHVRLPRLGRSGRGLEGVAERAATVGGRIEFGPDDLGFLLAAWLPLAGERVGP